MTCKDCMHYEACCTFDEFEEKPSGKDIKKWCGLFRDKNIFVELPFVAMIEQTLTNGKFSRKRGEQRYNGRYAVVYVDKSKWGTPLIDICGEVSYNREEAEQRLKEIKK